MRCNRNELSPAAALCSMLASLPLRHYLCLSLSFGSIRVLFRSASRPAAEAGGFVLPALPNFTHVNLCFAVG